MLVKVTDASTGRIVYVNPDKIVMIWPDSRVKGRMHAGMEGGGEVDLSGEDLDILLGVCNRDMPTSGYVTVSAGDAQEIRDMAKATGLVPEACTTMSTSSRQSHGEGK